jgi:hypothetical protein
MMERALVTGIGLVALLAAACGGDGASRTPTAAVASPAPTTAAQTPTACPSVQTTQLETLRRQQASPSGGLIATLDDVQVTTQPCLDRVTFSFTGDTLPGYDVRYEQSWTECGSGAPVYTQGPGQLVITFTPANAHDDAGQSTIGARSFTPSYPAIKEARLTCDFEAVVSWALGTEVRFFTVTTLQSPARIVVDVYH